MTEIMSVSRRGFLQSVFSAGALVLSVKLAPGGCGPRMQAVKRPLNAQRSTRHVGGH